MFCDLRDQMDTICAAFLWKLIEIGVLGDECARECACPLNIPEGRDFMVLYLFFNQLAYYRPEREREREREVLLPIKK
jgi:hypothetical protein